MGNQFLSHIREVDLILHVLRCFEDSNIIRSTDVDPISDFEIIVAELMLKDIESIDKRIPKIEKSLKGKLSAAELKSFHDEMQLLKDLRILLEKGDVIAVRQRAQSANLSGNPNRSPSGNFASIVSTGRSAPAAGGTGSLSQVFTSK